MNSLGRGRDSGKPDEENPYWISFSDIMSGLLMIFILASMVLIFELTKTKVEVTEAIEELKAAEKVRADLVRQIKLDLASMGIDVESAENESVIRIPDNLLAFDSNKYQIPNRKDVKDRVAAIASVLYSAIAVNDRWKYLDTVFVEGHTDNRISPREFGNWGLSTYRAIAVWLHWEEAQPPGQRLSEIKNFAGEPLFSMSGYAETRPLPTPSPSSGSQDSDKKQDDEDILRKNRRIDLRFTVKRPALTELNELREMLQ